MADPVLLQAVFNAGMKRDVSRDRLPEGACWGLVDMVPGREAPVATRGGWRAEDFVLSVEEPPYSAEHVSAVAWAEFAAGPQIVVVDDAGELFTSSAAPVALGEPGVLGWTELGAFEGDWSGVEPTDLGWRGDWDGTERHPFETPAARQQKESEPSFLASIPANGTSSFEVPAFDDQTVAGNMRFLTVFVGLDTNIPVIETPEGFTPVNNRSATGPGGHGASSLGFRLCTFKLEDAPAHSGAVTVTVRNPGPGARTAICKAIQFEYEGVDVQEPGTSAADGVSTTAATPTLTGTIEEDEVQVVAVGYDQQISTPASITSPTNGFSLVESSESVMQLALFHKLIVDGAGPRSASMSATLGASSFWVAAISVFLAKARTPFVEYAVGDVVEHEGSAWRAVAANGGDEAAEPGVDAAWEQVSVEYTAGDHVLYEGTLWRALNTNENQAPPDNPSHWTQVQGYVGVWSESGEYEAGDVVTHEAKAWRALALVDPTAPGTGTLTRSPVFFDNLLILPAANGTDPPVKYDGATTPAALGGSPPDGKYACVHRGRLALADGKRVWFSAPGDPETWMTDPETGSFVDVSAPIVGLASVFDHLLVFTDRRVERISGAIPPNEAGGDMELRSAFEVGCLDHRSIVVSGQSCVFASADGVYLTDGLSLVDLTDEGDMSTFWRQTVGLWDGVSVAAGLYQGHYVVCVSGTSPRTLVCRLNGNAWFRFTNIRTRMFARTTRTQDELYFGLYDAPTVARLSPAFLGSDPVDGDGTAVLGIVETAFYQPGGLGQKAWKRLFASYVSEPGTVAVDYVQHPHMSTYTDAGTLPAAEYGRHEVDLGFSSFGVAFRLVQQGSGVLHVHALEAVVEQKEASRGG